MTAQSSTYLSHRLESFKRRLEAYTPRPYIEGRVKRVVGLTVEVTGCKAPIGARCRIKYFDNEQDAEVVGFSERSLFLMPYQSITGIEPGAIVEPSHSFSEVNVSDELLGRVIDGLGEPIDGKGRCLGSRMSIEGIPINPLQREPIREPLDVGVRSINSLLTVGQGQRIGLFAGSGVGKSVLLGMMTKYTQADVIVVGLIGERGREVKEFIEDILGREGMKRAVVVAAPADTSPLERINGAKTATTIAEYFRDQGLNVLLLMDSLTRYCQALREIGLSVGEPPTTKGYPPSVFAKLPHLVERAGNADTGGGSITAFYTVLAEGDDNQDPIADAARAILDGHIVLSRSLAERGHYPAIDVTQSISRVMPQVTPEKELKQAQQFRQYYACLIEQQDLIRIGAYQSGSDPILDSAIKHKTAMDDFLKQSMHAGVARPQALSELSTLTQLLTSDAEVTS